MKIVKVTYTTSADYAEQNKTNIQSVMADLRQAGSSGINYNVCIGADGKTFTHTAFFQSDSDQKTLFDLPAFQRFQEQLKASKPETAPAQELLSLAGSSVDIF